MALSRTDFETSPQLAGHPTGELESSELLLRSYPLLSNLLAEFPEDVGSSFASNDLICAAVPQPDAVENSLERLAALYERYTYSGDSHIPPMCIPIEETDTVPQENIIERPSLSQLIKDYSSSNPILPVNPTSSHHPEPESDSESEFFDLYIPEQEDASFNSLTSLRPEDADFNSVLSVLERFDWDSYSYDHSDSLCSGPPSAPQQVENPGSGTTSYDNGELSFIGVQEDFFKYHNTPCPSYLPPRPTDSRWPDKRSRMERRKRTNPHCG